MKVISIINLKGGVAKTISSGNIAHILVAKHGYKVLMIDNDKQGNLSKLFRRYSHDKIGTEKIMTMPNSNINEIIQKTDYYGLDIITANMNLGKANLEVVTDQQMTQHTRFREALKQVKDRYDFVIIDNAPDINISTINSLVCSQDVLIPVKADSFSLEGLNQIEVRINNIKERLNSELVFKGCFITQYTRNNINKQYEEWVNSQNEYPFFKTHIRRTEKIDESTFKGMPIILYSRRCGAAQDYLKLVEEYLQK